MKRKNIIIIIITVLLIFLSTTYGILHFLYHILMGDPGYIENLSPNTSFVKEQFDILVINNEGVLKVSSDGSYKEILIQSEDIGQRFCSIKDWNTDRSHYALYANNGPALVQIEPYKYLQIAENIAISDAQFSKDGSKIAVTFRKDYKLPATIKIYSTKDLSCVSTTFINNNAIHQSGWENDSTVRFQEYTGSSGYIQSYKYHYLNINNLEFSEAEEFTDNYSSLDIDYSQCDKNLSFTDVAILQESSNTKLILIKGFMQSLDNEYGVPSLKWQFYSPSCEYGIFTFNGEVYILDINSGKKAKVISGSFVYPLHTN